MSFLSTALPSLGLRFFSSGEEFLLPFRGAILDHHVLLQEGEVFLHARCVMGRAPAASGSSWAARMLEWNAGHSMARVAISEGNFVVLADMPLQGLQPAGVEELLLTVATAAEDLMTFYLTCMMGADAAGASPGATPASPAVQDSEIDWELEK